MNMILAEDAACQLRVARLKYANPISLRRESRVILERFVEELGYADLIKEYRKTRECKGPFTGTSYTMAYEEGTL